MLRQCESLVAMHALLCLAALSCVAPAPAATAASGGYAMRMPGRAYESDWDDVDYGWGENVDAGDNDDPSSSSSSKRQQGKRSSRTGGWFMGAGREFNLFDTYQRKAQVAATVPKKTAAQAQHHEHESENDKPYDSPGWTIRVDDQSMDNDGSQRNGPQHNVNINAYRGGGGLWGSAQQPSRVDDGDDDDDESYYTSPRPGSSYARIGGGPSFAQARNPYGADPAYWRHNDEPKRRLPDAVYRVQDWWTRNVSPSFKGWPKIAVRIEPTTTLKIRKTIRPLKTIVRIGADFNTQLGVWQFKSSWEDAIIGGKLTLVGKELQLSKSWQLSVGAMEDLVTRLRFRAAIDLSTFKAYARVGFRTERLTPINMVDGFTILKRLPLDGNKGHVKLEVKANLALPEPEIEYSTETHRSLIGMGDIEININELNLLLDY